MLKITPQLATNLLEGLTGKCNSYYTSTLFVVLANEDTSGHLSNIPHHHQHLPVALVLDLEELQKVPYIYQSYLATMHWQIQAKFYCNNLLFYLKSDKIEQTL